MTTWWIYQGVGEPHDGISHLPPPPPWRMFDGRPPAQEPAREPDPQLSRRFGNLTRGHTFQATKKVIDLVNAALYLRRPLLVTGKPGTGKSSLAYAVAHELKLGRVLAWPITSRVTLQDGLYRYDAIGRLQEANLSGETPDIGQYIRLGPLGTAYTPRRWPRVLLIDEIDKSDIDLPNDLLHLFEEGGFDIHELVRLSEEEVDVLTYDSLERIKVEQGRVTCHAFPFVVITSNGERELPPPFLRRCLQLTIAEPTEAELAKIVQAHFSTLDDQSRLNCETLVQTFLERRKQGDLATDQLLNAIYLTTQGVDLNTSWDDRDKFIDAVLQYLTTLGTS